MENIFDLLPMPFWLGPPLPKFLGIYWPPLQQGEQLSLPPIPLLPAPGGYEELEEESSIVKKPAIILSNTQDTKLERDENGRITRIITHREVIEGKENE